MSYHADAADSAVSRSFAVQFATAIQKPWNWKNSFRMRIGKDDMLEGVGSGSWVALSTLR